MQQTDDEHAIDTSATPGTAIDPVCGMAVGIDGAQHIAEHDGARHYFCSARCKDKFLIDRDLYLSGAHLDAVEEVPAGTIYTCPMHPEIRQPGPGSCPICGMALEPETVSLDEGPDPELIDMRRRFWWSALLTIPLFAYAMGDLVPGISFERLIEPAWAQWAQLLLAAPVVLWGGWPFFVRAIQSVRTLNLNMFTLIGFGVAIAYLFSVVATVAPDIFPAAFRDHSGRVGVYFEAAAVITTLVLLGQVLELKARGSTSSALRALLSCAATMRSISTRPRAPIPRISEPCKRSKPRRMPSTSGSPKASQRRSARLKAWVIPALPTLGPGSRPGLRRSTASTIRPR